MCDDFGDCTFARKVIEVVPRIAAVSRRGTSDSPALRASSCSSLGSTRFSRWGHMSIWPSAKLSASTVQRDSMGFSWRAARAKPQSPA
eukprot:4951725-Prymnesium_polylepis.1